MLRDWERISKHNQHPEILLLFKYHREKTEKNMLITVCFASSVRNLKGFHYINVKMLKLVVL